MQSQPQQDPEISRFEDLDPEAIPRAHSFRREWIAGVLLLVVIAGWGGLSWWQAQSAYINYHLGEQALAAYDWESAQHYFLAAGDYNNAALRAADAARKAADRDKH